MNIVAMSTMLIPGLVGLFKDRRRSRSDQLQLARTVPSSQVNEAAAILLDFFEQCLQTFEPFQPLLFSR